MCVMDETRLVKTLEDLAAAPVTDLDVTGSTGVPWCPPSAPQRYASVGAGEQIPLSRGTARLPWKPSQTRAPNCCTHHKSPGCTDSPDAPKAPEGQGLMCVNGRGGCQLVSVVWLGWRGTASPARGRSLAVPGRTEARSRPRRNHDRAPRLAWRSCARIPHR
jgi:hypothetical protein